MFCDADGYGSLRCSSHHISRLGGHRRPPSTSPNLGRIVRIWSADQTENLAADGRPGNRATAHRQSGHRRSGQSRVTPRLCLGAAVGLGWLRSPTANRRDYSSIKSWIYIQISGGRKYPGAACVISSNRFEPRPDRRGRLPADEKRASHLSESGVSRTSRRLWKNRSVWLNTPRKLKR